MKGRLTTHVLDLSNGGPAVGMIVQLWKGSEHAGKLLIETQTNADGRLNRPLLENGELERGTYELVFFAGDYFRGTSSITGFQKAGEMFLERIPIRFSVVDPGAHYHVPLLVSIGGYSAYRGN